VNALFVHGMGRTLFSWSPTLIRFRSKGIKTFVFGYNVTLHDFSTIVDRLVKQLEQISRRGEYVVIGHSLGGVVLRAALHELPTGSRMPKTMFLLGSPVVAPRLALRLKRNPLFRTVTRDCGNLLGSEDRMSSIPEATIPVVGIVGTKGWGGRLSPFGSEPNDGIVTVGEVHAGWIAEEIRVPVVHTLLPSSGRVAEVMLERILKPGEQPRTL
jgi:pimeloyl-ACP methyl ester carboxylesterase